jgi:hypothetical protein
MGHPEEVTLCESLPLLSSRGRQTLIMQARPSAYSLYGSLIYPGVLYTG